MKIRITKLFAVVLALVLALPFLSARERTLHIVTTGDVHGAFFERDYIDPTQTKTSLMAVKAYVDSLRRAVGEDNVLLLDAGDCLQGDNASYYFNYVATDQKHVYPRMAAYMGYDVAVVGNHDVETGHPVYDRVFKDLQDAGIQWLGGNTPRTDGSSADPYFPLYVTLQKAGAKIAVIGFTNPNIKAWLSEKQWGGMDFVSLLPLAQECVDKVIAKEKPDVVVVATHSGTGAGDGHSLESQGLDLLKSLKGVDVVVAAHDHRPFTTSNDRGDCVLVNAGSKASVAAHVAIKMDLKGKKLQKSVSGEIVKLDKTKIDTQMQKTFSSDWEQVKAFTLQHVGELAMEMRTRDAYAGPSDYINLLHTVCLQSAPEAQIAFAAPLTFNGIIKKGELIYNDLFTIYHYENQMTVLRLKGSEIRNYLEYSYAGWIEPTEEHVLRIRNRPDPRTGTTRWSFAGASYNCDSASGINYTVDITKPKGSRVEIQSMADGTPFDLDAWYNVAMTSYRANGGGDLIIKGAGLSKDEIDSRIVGLYPEIRDLIYEFIKAHGTLTPELVGDKSKIGSWKFIPEQKASEMVASDMSLIF